MTVGAIEDIIMAYGDFVQGVTGKSTNSNQHGGTTRNATQADFDRFSNLF